MKRVKLLLSLLVALFFMQPTESSAQRVRVVLETSRRAARPPSPGSDYVWVEGRWVWDDYYRRDVWVEGYWMLREREHYCDRGCCQKHNHHYKRQKHGYAYGRHKNRHNHDDDDYDD